MAGADVIGFREVSFGLSNCAGKLLQLNWDSEAQANPF